MEGDLRRSGFGGEVQEKKRLHSYGDQDIEEVGYGRQVHEDNNLKPNSPNQKDLGIINKQVPNVTATKGPSMDPNPKACSSQMDQEDELESAKAEWSAATEENERLKTIIARIVKDHQSLQLHLLDIVGQEEDKKSKHTSPAHEEVEQSELISLSLGRSSSDPKKEENNSNSRKSNEDEELKEGLSLGLDCKFEVSKMDQMKPISNPSATNSFDVPKKEELGEQWPPSKILKTIRSGDDEEVSQQTHVKRARVTVRARCDSPTMNDGCHWRKYGQKIAKGNPCPRAYYRCTLAPACPVRKQVQRCYDNTSILNTTYEGTHNHPLPISATAMASTTSAAARMLLSGSSSSQPTIGASITTTTAANLHGVNFSLPDNLRSSQFYLPNSSISSLPSHPTITLDLTAPSSFSSSSSASQFSQLSSSNFSMMTPRYPSTNFNFSYSGSNSLPISWGNGYLTYGTQPDNKIQMGSLNLGRQTQEHIHQSHMEKNNITPPQQSLTDTVAAATKALTSDPSFRSVLATAIASIVGGGTVGPQGKKSGGLK